MGQMKAHLEDLKEDVSKLNEEMNQKVEVLLNKLKASDKMMAFEVGYEDYSFTDGLYIIGDKDVQHCVPYGESNDRKSYGIDALYSWLKLMEVNNLRGVLHDESIENFKEMIKVKEVDINFIVSYLLDIIPEGDDEEYSYTKENLKSTQRLQEEVNEIIGE